MPNYSYVGIQRHIFLSFSAATVLHMSYVVIIKALHGYWTIQFGIFTVEVLF